METGRRRNPAPAAGGASSDDGESRGAGCKAASEEPTAAESAPPVLVPEVGGRRSEGGGKAKPIEYGTAEYALMRTRVMILKQIRHCTVVLKKYPDLRTYDHARHELACVLITLDVTMRDCPRRAVILRECAAEFRKEMKGVRA